MVAAGGSGAVGCGHSGTGMAVWRYDSAGPVVACVVEVLEQVLLMQWAVGLKGCQAVVLVQVLSWCLVWNLIQTLPVFSMTSLSIVKHYNAWNLLGRPQS